MKGLELCEKYYLEYADVIFDEFPDLKPLLAAGLVGEGSECFGFDDELSQDHDFEPGFCLFAPDESVLDDRQLFKLERAYAKLPREFMGFKRGMMTPAGGARKGVMRTSDFYSFFTGSAGKIESLCEWFSIPESALACATNGRVFSDPLGEFSALREYFSFFPRDVMLKKLAGCLAVMAQSGQYNYERCVKRGDNGAAQLAAFEFARAAVHAAFLLNGRYMPYYKWVFASLKGLEELSGLYDIAEYLITSDNLGGAEQTKTELMEDAVSMITASLSQLELTDAICLDAGKHANSVNDRIEDSFIRNMDLFAGLPHA